VYWGYVTTGLMREGGHVIFLSGWVFLIWAAGDLVPAWILATGFGLVRAAEIAVMMLLPALAENKLNLLWQLNDLVGISVVVVLLVAIAVLISRTSKKLA
jgi:hypothetical protein